jgi:tRNA dimethylallyltransferase
VSFEILALVGPTASGKSDLAIAIAQAVADQGIELEIVNADAMQLYSKMNIGTAKLSPSRRQEIPHYLFDILSPSQEMTAVEYQRLAREKFEEIASRGATPFLVGGSMFYISAALDGLEFAPTDPLIRSSLEREAEELGPGILFSRLESVDPETAKVIPRQNIRRVIRALEVIAITGQPYSNSLPNPTYYQPTLTLGIEVEREELKARIRARVLQMWESGLLEEARQLQAEFRLSRTAAVAIGYAQAFAELQGAMTQAQAIEETIQLTNRYARRQMSWFRRDSRIQWLKSSDQLLESALERIRLAK